VQKGKFAACALALLKQLNKVDFPTLGKPTIPHFKAILIKEVIKLICKDTNLTKLLIVF
jgi:hypothetical protein